MNRVREGTAQEKEEDKARNTMHLLVHSQLLRNTSSLTLKDIDVKEVLTRSSVNF
jgi:hypothetical protein